MLGQGLPAWPSGVSKVCVSLVVPCVGVLVVAGVAIKLVEKHITMIGEGEEENVWKTPL